jgi:hypothetical protein
MSACSPARPARHGERGRRQIGTATLLAASNAAVYVAQMEDERVTEALATTKYLDVTRATLRRHGGLWFNDELFVIVRRA